MSLKSQATGFVRYVEGVIKALPENKQSSWVMTQDASRAAGADAEELKKILRRPRVKSLLKKAGIGCSYRQTALYVFKTAEYGQTGVDDGDLDSLDAEDETTPATPAAPADMSLDTNYFYFPDPITADIETAIDAGKNVFVVGPAGSGKSSLLSRICERRGVRPIIVSFHGEVSVDDLVGTKDLVDGQTVWTDGVLPICMRRGIPLIIDEADATPPDVQFVLHPVLMGQPLCLTRKGAEFVHPEPGFGIWATGNTVGRGDDSGLYVGTNVLNEAYLDRYGVVIDHWYMPETEEVTVLVKRTGIHKRSAEKMVSVAKLARDAMRADQLSSTFSTRKMLDWCDLVVRGMDLGRAYLYSCINKVGREDRRVLAEFGQRIFGASLGIDPSRFV